MDTAPKTEPEQKRRGSRPLLAVMVVLIVVLLLHVPPIVDFLWQKSRGTRFEPIATRWAIANSDPNKRPVEVALARDRIVEGQAMDDVITRHGPFHVSRFGPFATLEPPDTANGFIPFESYQIIAKDGRLRQAAWWSCTGTLTFFNSFSKNDEAEFVAERTRYWRVRTHARLEAQMAIGGTGLFEHIHTLPRPDPQRDARLAVAGGAAYIEPFTAIRREDD
jgi:hypothetical protein